MEKVCPVHKRYKVVQRPRAACAACWWLWKTKFPDKFNSDDITAEKAAITKEGNVPKEWHD